MESKLSVNQFKLLEDTVSNFPKLIDLCNRIKDNDFDVSVLTAEQRELLAEQALNSLLLNGLASGDEPNDFGQKIDEIIGVLYYNIGSK